MSALLDHNDELVNNQPGRLYGALMLHQGRRVQLTHYGASIEWGVYGLPPPLRMQDIMKWWMLARDMRPDGTYNVSIRELG